MESLYINLNATISVGKIANKRMIVKSNTGFIVLPFLSYPLISRNYLMYGLGIKWYFVRINVRL